MAVLLASAASFHPDDTNSGAGAKSDVSRTYVEGLDTTLRLQISARLPLLRGDEAVKLLATKSAELDSRVLLDILRHRWRVNMVAMQCVIFFVVYVFLITCLSII